VLYYTYLKWSQASAKRLTGAGAGELVLVGGEELVRFELVPMETDLERELEQQLEALEDENSLTLTLTLTLIGGLRGRELLSAC